MRTNPKQTEFVDSTPKTAFLFQKYGVLLLASHRVQKLAFTFNTFPWKQNVQIILIPRSKCVPFLNLLSTFILVHYSLTSDGPMDAEPQMRNVPCLTKPYSNPIPLVVPNIWLDLGMSQSTLEGTRHPIEMKWFFMECFQNRSVIESGSMERRR